MWNGISLISKLNAGCSLENTVILNTVKALVFWHPHTVLLAYKKGKNGK